MQKNHNRQKSPAKGRMTAVFLLSFLLVVLVCGFIYATMKRNEEHVLETFRTAQNSVAAAEAQTLRQMQENPEDAKNAADAESPEAWLRNQGIGGFDTEFSLTETGSTGGGETDPVVTSRITGDTGVVETKVTWQDNQDQAYTLTLTTTANSILTVSGAQEHTYYVVLASLFMGLVLFGVLITYVGHLNQTEKELSGTRDRLQVRDAQMENPDVLREVVSRVQEEKEPATGRDTSQSGSGTPSETPEMTAAATAEYRFKFYLNARHAMYTNGIEGEVHPHTWEIAIRVRKVSDAFIPFNSLEKKTNEFLDRYQDKVLNEIPPFDKLNPTVENLTVYFAAEIKPRLKEDGWSLLEMEISESPARSYVLVLEEENSAGSSDNNSSNAPDDYAERS